MCQECSSLTRSNTHRTKCLPYDQVKTSDNKLINLFKVLRYDLFCDKAENQHACDDEESSLVGPVKLDPTSNSKS